MLDLDRKKIIGALAAEHGIHIDEDDPALTIVTLNGLMLERYSDQIGQRLISSLKQLDDGMNKVQQRAGQLLAADFNDRLASMRKALEDDIAVAGARANEFVFRAEQANRHPVMIRWAVTGTVAALILFLMGLWIGARYIHS